MALLTIQPAHAQKRTRKKEQTPTVVSTYSDSIKTLARSISYRTPSVKTLTPEMYRIIGPATYYRSATDNALAINWANADDREKTLSDSKKGEHKQALTTSIDETLFKLYVTSPNRLRSYEDLIEKEELIDAKPIKEVEKKELDQILTNVNEIKDVAVVVDNVDMDIKVTKPNFWKTTCQFSSTFTQNYFSENWYKGNENNTNMLNRLYMTATYNNQQNITWENTLEMKLGFITTNNDTCHNYLTNNDRIRLWSKFGLKAAKSWSYTATLEATTQFLPSYRSNDKRKYAAFLAPLDMILSIGMDFKPSFKNGNTVSVALLPLSYKMRYIGSDDETIHKATNMVDKDKSEDFGAKIEANSKVTLAKNLTWNMRFYCFTSYEYVESELENRLEFRFNKYISSEIYTLWRFDDNRPKDLYDDNLGYFQFREYLTFGITYDF